MEAYTEGDPAVEADEARLAEIEQRIAAIQHATKTDDPQEQALAGCIVYVDHYGALQVGRGYVKAEDKTALEQLRRGESADREDGAPVLSVPEPETGYSAALVEELTAICTAAIAGGTGEPSPRCPCPPALSDGGPHLP
ncbi:hypothetical protein J2X76_003944 [Neorhizobium sp. 2083]|uniref:hypothetical protein n=1 Tax=Neorhizobium sp. 2083 TaxID=2817762 RepID=UPI002858140B|nr:hypothetical protein [Neorhizobium sp. 2083]MDR6818762.1 hypothetical protein [Neorhizobium sp. 2083]